MFFALQHGMPFSNHAMLRGFGISVASFLPSQFLIDRLLGLDIEDLSTR
jgi:hypothetical protein